jgi:hypothetical protein
MITGPDDRDAVLPSSHPRVAAASWVEALRKPDTRLLAPLRLPRRYADARLAEIPKAGLRTLVRAYCDQFAEAAARGVAPGLFGATQSWKTYAACVVCRYVWHVQRLDVEFVQCAAEFAQLERDRFAPAAAARLERLATAPFVVLDDFPLVPPGGYAAGMLIEVCSRRFDALLPTCYTGNILPRPKSAGDATDEVTARYGPQFSRRLLDATVGYRMAFAVQPPSAA